MKKFKLIAAVAILSTLVLISGCKKENVCDTCTTKDNKPPIAIAGPDQVITLPLNSVILNGQSSSDPDGSIRHFRWNKITGPFDATLQKPDSARTEVNGLTAGVYQYELTVTDDQGLAAKDTVRIFVDAIATSNHPPVAVAGDDQTLTLPVNATLINGSASYDLENNITSRQWTKISGPNAGVITSPDLSLTTVTQLVEGIYGFELKIMDSGGLEGRDTMMITVQASTNRPPEANAGSDQSLVLPLNSATLNGIASTDPDNNLTSYLWKRISGPAAVIQQPTNVQTNVQVVSAGVYRFQLTVTDAGGLSDSDTMQISVTPAINFPPTANAGPDQVITLPVDVAMLNGQNSTDPENAIVAYDWTQLTGPAPATILYFGYFSQVSNLVQGQYQFELKVMDNGGLTSRDTMKVTVNGLPTGSPAVFDNLFWVDNCVLKVPNIYSFIPPASTLTVELKRYEYQGPPSAWIPVRMQGLQLPGDFAYYVIENGNLLVYPIDLDCSFDNAQSYSIKISY